MILLEEEVPTLVHGEKMTPAEFMRRWEAHPEIKHAELVGGRIVMPPPVGADHCFSEGQIGTWLGTYAATTPGCASGHNPTTFLGDDVLQPDVNLIILPEWGGASWIEKNYLHGCPELIAELAKSSIHRDLTTRRDILEKAGVKEYLVVNLKDREVRWHCMIDGVYQLLAPDADGIYHSLEFPGLWLNSTALLEGKMGKVLATLHKGMASKEYLDFVAALNARKPQ